MTLADRLAAAIADVLNAASIDELNDPDALEAAGQRTADAALELLTVGRTIRRDRIMRDHPSLFDDIVDVDTSGRL